jgi:YesN/AraC family two-component response regulator
VRFRRFGLGGPKRWRDCWQVKSDDKKGGSVLRVLIVDDEAAIRELVRSVATMKGYEALEAESGLQGLEIAHRFTCDLIITDQEMPGMKGVELIARLTSERYPARCLIVSGFGVSGPLPTGLRVLAKPFTVTQLLEVLEELISNRTVPETGVGIAGGQTGVGGSHR